MKKTIFTVIIIFTMFFFMSEVKAISCDYKIKVGNQNIKMNVTETAEFSGAEYATIKKNVKFTLEDGTVVSSGDKVKIDGKRYTLSNNLSSKKYKESEIQNYISDRNHERECEDLSYLTETDLGILSDYTIRVGDKGKYTGQYSTKITSTTNKNNDTSNDKENNGQNGNGPGLNEKNDCESLLGEETTKWLNWLLKLIQIAGPIITLVLGMLDFVNAVLSSEDGAIKKAWGKFIRRVIAAIALIILPVIINLILEATNITSNGTCGIK